MEFAIIVWLIACCYIIYRSCMDGYTNKRKNSKDWREINELQKRRDIEQVKQQEKYDNDWGIL